MNAHFSPNYVKSLAHTQSGSTLVMVLIVLVLIILAGTASVINSRMDLRLAGASQIDTLLFTSAEQPNVKLEQEAANPKSKLFSSTQGLVGYFSGPIGETNRDDLLVICYRPKSKNLFELRFVAQIKGTGGRVDKNQNKPFCDVTEKSDFLSDRNTTLTQIEVTSGNMARQFTSGTMIGPNSPENYAVNINTLATLPTYSSASDEAINTCFKGKAVTDAGDLDKSIECLGDEGVPFRTVSQQYVGEYDASIMTP